MSDYLVIDVETVPLDLDEYFEAPEDETDNFLNPVDSKIIAAGIRHDGEDHVFIGENEGDILEEFWLRWGRIRKGDKKVVGFNINNFDMRMLVGRSLANEVGVMPFTKGDLVDLRERLSCFGWRPKGTLEDYAELTGVEVQETESSRIAHMADKGEIDKIKHHLKEDLRITDEVFQKSRDLNITKIEKW